MVKFTGKCACGAVSWRHSGTLIMHLACHCESCRRATSSAFATFLGTKPENVTWKGEITHFKSSPEGKRGFCPSCGTRLYFKSERWPGELHIHIGTMDTPNAITPGTHVVLEEAVSWIMLSDDIQKSESFFLKPIGASDD